MLSQFFGGNITSVPHHNIVNNTSLDPAWWDHAFIIRTSSWIYLIRIAPPRSCKKYICSQLRCLGRSIHLKWMRQINESKDSRAISSIEVWHSILRRIKVFEWKISYHGSNRILEDNKLSSLFARDFLTCLQRNLKTDASSFMTWQSCSFLWCEWRWCNLFVKNHQVILSFILKTIIM